MTRINCPHCGSEMRLRRIGNGRWWRKGATRVWFVCALCGWREPTV